MTDSDLDKVVETIKRLPFGPTEDNLPLCDPTGKTIKRDDPRTTVTMFKPLEPWPLNAFHKTLAVHIHNSTRPAKHSHLAANYGIMDNEQDARRWDFEGVKE